MKHRLLIAAAKSGSGKTILTCGLLHVLLDAGADVASFKCGPDYIDPMFHRSVFDVYSGNLDSFFSDEESICRALAESPGDTALIEGVMGIYDGTGVPAAGDSPSGISRKGSCYDIARITQTPILLVVDAKGMGSTLLSIVKGILADDTEHLIRGVVINRIGAVYFDRMRTALEELLSGISQERSASVELIGALRDEKRMTLESRHLGLVTPEEIADINARIDLAAEQIRSGCDLDRLRAIMRAAPEIPHTEDVAKGDKVASCALTLAVARDEAFCFYYEENLNLLRKLGVQIRTFSPIWDETVPEADGLLLGGGYPELYAQKLSENVSMRESVRSAIAGGMPSLAECGGFLYLQRELETKEGAAHPMCGVIPGRAVYAGRSSHFGYLTLCPAEELKKQDGAEKEQSRVDGGVMLSDGLRIRGHEFHYYETDQNGSDAIAVKPSGASWSCMHAGPEHLWGFPHLYYPSCPELVGRFVDQMKRYHLGKSDRDHNS